MLFTVPVYRARVREEMPSSKRWLSGPFVGGRNPSHEWPRSVDGLEYGSALPPLRRPHGDRGSVPSPTGVEIEMSSGGSLFAISVKAHDSLSVTVVTQGLQRDGVRGCPKSLGRMALRTSKVGDFNIRFVR